MQISRIRLSDKTSRLHPRHVVARSAQFTQNGRFGQDLILATNSARIASRVPTKAAAVDRLY
jgi:hypothetical protein